MNRILSAALMSVFVFGMSFAHGEESTEGSDKGARKEARQAFRKEQHARRKEHYKTQKTENKEFIKSLKDKDPQGVVLSLRSQLTKQYAENIAFAEEQHARLVAYITESAAKSGKNVDERLAKIKECFDKKLTHRKMQHAENLTHLDKLSRQEDLTKKQVRTSIKEHRKTQKAENQAFRKTMREACGRKGKKSGGDAAAE